ncbi:MAG TPA: NAD-dependent epimerase/dehydratase family protein [Pseudonocardia sp.]
MRLLVLGGGGFLGHHVVAAARAAGHAVTVYSRSGDTPFRDVEALTGDRHGDLAPLAGRTWDAAVDTFTDTAPGAPAVRAAGRLLSGSVGVYAYVSGMSVYAPAGPAHPDESAPVRRAGVEPDDDPLQERSLAKLAGEQALAEVFDGPVLRPRVGIMVGPRDPTHRFTYWPRRLAGALAGSRPATVLVPGDPDRTVQYSDARDTAAWVVAMVAAGRGGVFNTVGPGRPDTLAAVLRACLRAAGGDPDGGDGGTDGPVRFVRADEGFLRERLADVEEERRPLWYPEDQIPQTAIDSTAALAAGLRFRPAEETARDVLAQARETGEEGLDTAAFAERERALLAALAGRG